MGKIYATTNPEISERERRNMERSRKIATQGMVLLENDETLPLCKSMGNLALFGDGARRTVKGGTGSGDVNSRQVINVEQGLKEAGFNITTTAWLDRYDRAIADAKAIFDAEARKKAETLGAQVFWDLFNNPFRDPVIIPITQEDIDASHTDTAVYVLARNSGEGKDRRLVVGEYELYEEEKAAIEMLTANYHKVIVVLNIGAVIDTKFLRSQKGINAILLMSQAGNIGGHALADVLTGKVTPSGHLTSTWAENYTDYPSSDSFSFMNGDTDDEYYKEGIYVGYRYFDSFNIKPAYPFGYGLSYTTFDIQTNQVTLEQNKVNISVTVQNTGDTFAGRQVVQAYYSAPTGRLAKTYQELAAFAKTRELEPGEKQELTLTFKVEDMASYDVQTASWVLEEGNYYVRIGTDSRSTKVVANLKLNKEVITEKLSNRFPLDCNLETITAKEEDFYSYDTESAEKEAAPVLLIQPDDISYCEVSYSSSSDNVGNGIDGESCQDKENESQNDKAQNDKVQNDCHNQNPTPVITIDDVKAGKATLDELVDQLSIREMAEMCVGTARGGLGSLSVIGAASMTPGAAGDTAVLFIKDRNIRSLVLADGPAGLRLSRTFMVDHDGNPIAGSGDMPMPSMEVIADKFPKPEIPEDAIEHYQYCTALPIATLLAQTWDEDAIFEAGDIVGEEMNEMGVTLWLAPGMNIHRSPLCGRNFEYYSEDPLVSGICAAATTRGVQKHPGVGTTVKHFAFNNQEDNRMHTNAHIDERAIREIYLKGFEIAVKTSQPMSIMTSYNLINGVNTANSVDLLNVVAREEWGFAGIVMTDWGTTGSLDAGDGKDAFKYGYSSPAGCIKAGNDLIMPGSQEDVDDIVRSVGAKEGEVRCPITLTDLKACVKRMIHLIMQTSAYEDAVPYRKFNN